MTQKEKIKELQSTIIFLYEKEGRSKSYIARLLDLDRKTLSIQMKEWNLKQANKKYLTPSNQKFANKNKQLIKSRLDNDISVKDISKELRVGYDYLLNIIHRTDILEKAYSDMQNRKERCAIDRIENIKEKSTRFYNFKELDGELWKPILGYNGYYISNMGRVKKYAKKYKSYYLLKPEANSLTGRLYIRIKDKNLQVSRLVGFAFVEGYSEVNNTIEHRDNDVQNNKSSNLQWMSQKDNNLNAYRKGRTSAIAFSKRKKFKKIIVDNMFEFKTIRAFCRFFNVSETQGTRYLDGKVNSFNHIVEFVY